MATRDPNCSILNKFHFLQIAIYSLVLLKLRFLQLLAIDGNLDLFFGTGDLVSVIKVHDLDLLQN